MAQQQQVRVYVRTYNEVRTKTGRRLYMFIALRYNALGVTCVGDGEAIIEVAPSRDYELRINLTQCGIRPGDVLLIEEEPGRKIRVRRLTTIGELVNNFICDFVFGKAESWRGSAIVIRSEDIIKWFEGRFGIEVADVGSQYVIAKLKRRIARRLRELLGEDAVSLFGPPGRTVVMISRSALSSARQNPPC